MRPGGIPLPKYLIVIVFLSQTTITVMSLELPPLSTEILTLTRCVFSVRLSGWLSLTVRGSLSRHVLSEQIRLGAAATGDLTLLINAIEFTSKFIASNVRKARLINLFGLPSCSHSHSCINFRLVLAWLGTQTCKVKSRRN